MKASVTEQQGDTPFQSLINSLTPPAQRIRMGNGNQQGSPSGQSGSTATSNSSIGIKLPKILFRNSMVRSLNFNLSGNVLRPLFMRTIASRQFTS